MDGKEEATIGLANAVKELASAIRQGNEQRTNIVKLTVFTPSTGGEIILEWDPRQPMTEFMKYLEDNMARREEALKAGLEINARLGIGAKKESKGA
ncbi:MAG: hypothetical protein WC375_07620 [Methanomassiliicoccales archaeon]|jgi:hypothetical protein